jgi:tRNA(Phe) wybutosine-synthesizing methylase Tyw3
MPRPIHETIPVQVWADIDVGIADLVKLLNKIPGVRTFASCQGTIGEGTVC